MRKDAKNRLYEASARTEISISLNELGSHINSPIVGRQLALQNLVNLSDVLCDSGLKGLRIATSERHPPEKVLEEPLAVSGRLVGMLVKEIGKRDDQAGVRQQPRNRDAVVVAKVLDAGPNPLNRFWAVVDH